MPGGGVRVSVRTNNVNGVVSKGVRRIGSGIKARTFRQSTIQILSGHYGKQDENKTSGERLTTVGRHAFSPDHCLPPHPLPPQIGLRSDFEPEANLSNFSFSADYRQRRSYVSQILCRLVGVENVSGRSRLGMTLRLTQGVN